MFELVALLPMKAHSERVEGKNFKKFKSKPLFRWVLDKLIEINEIDRVIINTDATDVIRGYGLPSSDKIILRERKQELCGDYVSMNKIIENDLDAISSKSYLMTHTTNPLISTETFVDAIKTYKALDREKHDSLFTVNKYQSRFYSDKTDPINHDPDQLIRTQDLPPLYEENSCIYMFSQESFKASGARIGLKPEMYPTPFFESVDIDDATSWKLAELYFEYLNTLL